MHIDEPKGTPHAQPLSQYKMFCTPCRASYGVRASMRLPDRGLFRKSKGPFVIGGTDMKRTTLTAHEASDAHSVAVEHDSGAAKVDFSPESCILLRKHETLHKCSLVPINH